MARLELSAATYALLRETRRRLDEEHGARLDDDQLVATLCARAVGGDAGDARNGVAKFQIAMHVCARCDRAWQIGAGAKIPVDAATLERARCDAQHLGPIDAAHPARAHQDIPPAVARLVWTRDHGRCQTPGCRSARGLEIHHIVRRADGGTHDPANLTLRCSSCHAAHHAGILTIRGSAPDALVTIRNVGASTEPSARQQAIAALTALGWSRAIACAATDEAMGHVARGEPLDVVIREALRRCPRPVAA